MENGNNVDNLEYEKRLSIVFRIGVVVAFIAWAIMVLRAERLSEMANSIWPLVTGNVLALISLVSYILVLKKAKDSALKNVDKLNWKPLLSIVIFAVVSSVFSIGYAYWLGLTT